MSKIIIVRHHSDDLDDTASTELTALGYQVENWFPFTAPASKDHPSLANVNGTIIMGGEQNVTELDSYPYLSVELAWIKACIDKDLPVIGICLGSQLLAHALGGNVAAHTDGRCEFGYETVSPVPGNNWITEPLRVVQAHFQGFDLPAKAELLATGENFPCQAFKHKHNVFGFQFHPEVHSLMFEQWQQADWSETFKATAGSQPANRQLTDNRKYNDTQTQWFRDFLAKIFPHVT